MQLLTAAQMREIDRRTIADVGIPGTVLMENAGRAVVAELTREYGSHYPGPVLVLAGKGNNGGDGYVIARCLQIAGWQVRTLVLAEGKEISGDARINLDSLRSLGGDLVYISTLSSLRSQLGLENPAIVVDALLGTGVQNQVRELYAADIAWMNKQSSPVCAVDIPSGVCSDTGAILGTAVRATMTVSLGSAKIGQVVTPGLDCCGRLAVVDIGLPVALFPDPPEARLIDEALVKALLPKRDLASHKGNHGHLLVWAGGPGTVGAAHLTARAALRGGAGLVTLAGCEELQALFAGALPEAMTLKLSGTGAEMAAAIARGMEGRDVLALGPGLGSHPELIEAIASLLGGLDRPLVIDADGLNALVGHLDWLEGCKTDTIVLTPHPGEMARLLNCDVKDVQNSRLRVAREFAVKYSVVLVLKGAGTVLAAPDGRTWVNGSGNPILATGGSGDVLTGLIGALLAQGLEPLAAAGCAVFLHGLAADRLQEKYGSAGGLASEVADLIPAVRFRMEKGEV